MNGMVKLKQQRTRYDWSVRWKSGGIARTGRDFTCSINDFRSAVYQHARRNGLVAAVTVKRKTVEFRFTKKQNEPTRGTERQRRDRPRQHGHQGHRAAAEVARGVAGN